MNRTSHEVCMQQTDIKRLSQAVLRLIATVSVVLGGMACGDEAVCPQGSVSESGGCFLIQSDASSVEIPLYDAIDKETTAKDVVLFDDGTEQDAVESASTLDALPDVSKVQAPIEPASQRRHRAINRSRTFSADDAGPVVLQEARKPYLCPYQDPETQTAPLITVTRHQQRKDAHGVAQLPPLEREEPALVLRDARVLFDRLIRAGANERIHVKEDVDQYGRGRESRRNSRGWSIGQSRVGNPQQGAA